MRTIFIERRNLSEVSENATNLKEFLMQENNPSMYLINRIVAKAYRLTPPSGNSRAADMTERIRRNASAAKMLYGLYTDAIDAMRAEIVSLTEMIIAEDEAEKAEKQNALELAKQAKAIKDAERYKQKKIAAETQPDK